MEHELALTSDHKNERARRRRSDLVGMGALGCAALSQWRHDAESFKYLWLQDKQRVVHMPAMTGIELHRRLIDGGHAIPTILVTACPNAIDRARALNDGGVCYLRKPVDEQSSYGVFVRLLRLVNRLKRTHECVSAPGKVN